jgi:hypothetical protein
MAHFLCHSRENGNSDLSLRKQGTISGIWIPRIKCGAGSASAGMTTFLAVFFYNFQNSKLIQKF